MHPSSAYLFYKGFHAYYLQLAARLPDRKKFDWSFLQDLLFGMELRKRAVINIKIQFVFDTLMISYGCDMKIRHHHITVFDFIL